MTIKEATEVIHQSRFNGMPFSIEFVSCDVKRKKGGKLISLEGCVAANAAHDEMAHGTITIKAPEKSHPIPVHVPLIMKVNNEFVQ